MNKQPEPDFVFARGPSVSPAGTLLAWLAAQTDTDGQPSLVKLPVRLTFTASQLALASAHVGALAITVDDGALGVSLFDRARRACPERDACTMWLIGRWRAPASFSLRYIPRPIPDDEVASATYAEVVVARQPRA